VITAIIDEKKFSRKAGEQTSVHWPARRSDCLSLWPT
jgi:hypothetical protein